MLEVTHNRWKTREFAGISILDNIKIQCSGKEIDSGDIKIKNKACKFQIKKREKIEYLGKERKKTVTTKYSICIDYNGKKYGKSNITKHFLENLWHHPFEIRKEKTGGLSQPFKYRVTKKNSKKSKTFDLEEFSVEEFVKSYEGNYNKTIFQTPLNQIEPTIPLFALLRSSDQRFKLLLTVESKYFDRTLNSFSGRVYDKILFIDSVSDSLINSLSNFTQDDIGRLRDEKAFNYLKKNYKNGNFEIIKKEEIQNRYILIKEILNKVNAVTGTKSQPVGLSIFDSFLKPLFDTILASYDFIKPEELFNDFSIPFNKEQNIELLKTIEIYARVFSLKIKISCNSKSKIEIENILRISKLQIQGIEFLLQEDSTKISIKYE